jgi:hypothetical protein
MATQQFSTVDAVARAIYAFDKNGGKIERESYSRDGVTTLEANRVIMKVMDLDISDYRDRADALITHLQHVEMIKIISGGNINAFFSSILDLVKKEKVTEREFGVLAWAPKLAADFKKREELNETMSIYQARSRYAGNVGDRVELEFTMLEARYIRSMDMNLIIGHGPDDNLYQFWAKDDKIIKKGRIKARIKAHVEDRYNANARVNVLSYVKVINEQTT